MKCPYPKTRPTIGLCTEMSRIRDSGIVAMFWVRMPCTRNTRMFVMTNRSILRSRIRQLACRAMAAADDRRQPPRLRGDSEGQRSTTSPSEQFEDRPHDRSPVLAHLVDHHLALVGDEVPRDPRVEHDQPLASATKKLVIATPAPHTAPTAPCTAFAASCGRVTR